MSIILIIIVLVICFGEDLKDQHDVNKWRNSGGMSSRYNCWKNDKKK